MIEIRKTINTRETVFSELGVEANRPTTRVVAMPNCPSSPPPCDISIGEKL